VTPAAIVDGLGIAGVVVVVVLVVVVVVVVVVGGGGGAVVVAVVSVSAVADGDAARTAAESIPAAAHATSRVNASPRLTRGV
jgi:hypothetical protein